MSLKLINQSILFWIAGLVILIDQVTKYLVRERMPVGSVWAFSPESEPFFRLLHIENNGAAFGMFQQAGAFFSAIAIIVSGVIVYYGLRLPEGQWLLRVILGLQLGGALGNLIDRLVRGPVTDFFNVMAMWHTPVFNVADLSITVGVILLLTLMLAERRARPAPAAPPPAES